MKTGRRWLQAKEKGLERIWTFSLQKCEKIDFCCLDHSLWYFVNSNPSKLIWVTCLLGCSEIPNTPNLPVPKEQFAVLNAKTLKLFNSSHRQDMGERNLDGSMEKVITICLLSPLPTVLSMASSWLIL